MPADHTRRRTGRFIFRVSVEVAAVALVLVVAVSASSVAVASTTWRATIPTSCHQPATTDYSKVGRPYYGPYEVRLETWHHLPWGDSSTALVGHGLSADSRVGYGVLLDVESVDIDRYQCRWSDTGVTIVEPIAPPLKSSVEHFVPAELFLGGR